MLTATILQSYDVTIVCRVTIRMAVADWFIKEDKVTNTENFWGKNKGI